jgi:hypothetical protein
MPTTKPTKYYDSAGRCFTLVTAISANRFEFNVRYVRNRNAQERTRRLAFPDGELIRVYASHTLQHCCGVLLVHRIKFERGSRTAVVVADMRN